MKKNIFLTASVHLGAEDIGKKIGAKENKLKLLFVNTAAELEKGDKQCGNIQVAYNGRSQIDDIKIRDRKGKVPLISAPFPASQPVKDQL